MHEACIPSIAEGANYQQRGETGARRKSRRYSPPAPLRSFGQDFAGFFGWLFRARSRLSRKGMLTVYAPINILLGLDLIQPDSVVHGRVSMFFWRMAWGTGKFAVECRVLCVSSQCVIPQTLGRTAEKV